MNTKEEGYTFLGKGIFKDEHPIYNGLSVRYEKVDDAFMIVVDNGKTWISLYDTYEEGLKVFCHMTKKDK